MKKQLEIKFSHTYPKLWGQEEAILLDVKLIFAETLPQELIEYDTHWIEKGKNADEGWYQLPKKGALLQLIFYGSKGIPFCTIRRKTPQKEKWYKDNIGEVFKVVLTSTQPKP